MSQDTGSTETIRDGGLNITEPASMLEVVIGAASSGAYNTYVEYADPAALHDAHGEGPGVLTADDSLSIAGGPIGFVRCNTSVAQVIGAVTGAFTQGGSKASFTHSPDTGAGPDIVTGDVNATQANGDHTYAIVVTTAGALGTMAFTIAVDGGAASAPITSIVSGVYSNTATGVVITFPAGTYVLNDGYGFAVTAGGGTITVTGTAALDALVRVEILSTGARGTATFRYSLDGYSGDTESERTYSEPLVTPSGGTFAVPGLGINIVFVVTRTFYVGDSFTCQVQCAAPNATDLADAMAPLVATERPWRFVTVATSKRVGDSTAHGLLATALQSQLSALAAESVYRAGMISTGGTTAAEAYAAFSSVTAIRCLTAYGEVRRATIKPFAGFAFPTTPAVDVMASRAADSLPSTDLKRVADGPLQQVVKLFHDERATPSGLDDIKVATLKTFRGLGKNAYIRQGRIKSAPGSDFTIWPRRIVMDIACETVHEMLIREIGKGLRTTTVTIGNTTYPGVIDPRDRGSIENRVSAALVSRLVTPLNREGVPGHVSDLRYKISPTHNFLSTGVILGQVSIVPLGYVDRAETDLGFAVALPEEA